MLIIVLLYPRLLYTSWKMAKVYPRRILSIKVESCWVLGRLRVRVLRSERFGIHLSLQSSRNHETWLVKVARNIWRRTFVKSHHTWRKRSTKFSTTVSNHAPKMDTNILMQLTILTFIKYVTKFEKWVILISSRSTKPGVRNQ